MDKRDRSVVAYFRCLRESKVSLTPFLAFLGILAALGRSVWSIGLAVAILVATWAWDYTRWRRSR